GAPTPPEPGQRLRHVDSQHGGGTGERRGEAVANSGDDDGRTGEVAGVDVACRAHGGCEPSGYRLGTPSGVDPELEGAGSGSLRAVTDQLLLDSEASGTRDRLPVDGAGADGGAGQSVGGSREVA